MFDLGYKGNTIISEYQIYFVIEMLKDNTIDDHQLIKSGNVHLP
jgi:hypothetical protein